MVKSMRPVNGARRLSGKVGNDCIVLEGAITNDQFQACTSVSIITAWRTKAFWDWITFLVFQTRQGCTNSRELAFSTGKDENNNDKTLVMIRQPILPVYS